MYTYATKLAYDLLSQKLADDPYPSPKKNTLGGVVSGFALGMRR